MIALIGAGPLGLEMAIELEWAGLEYMHFEAGQIGATMAWWAPGTRWFSSNERISIAGVPLVTPYQEKATREEYLAYLRGVVEQFHLNVRTYTQVVGIKPMPERGFELRVRPALHAEEPEKVITAEKVIMATGGTATPNMLNVRGENLPHVSHYFQDPHMYFGKKVLIVGGRNSAVEAAMRCYRAGAHVHFSYRGTTVDAKDIKYWLYPEFASLLKSGKIVGHFGTVVWEIRPGDVVMASAENPQGVSKIVPADFVLLMTGYQADVSLARMAGVALTDEQGVPILNPNTMETSVPGMYVVGTAVAGTQRRYKVFLENCHVHVKKVVAHLMGRQATHEAEAAEILARPES